MHKVFLCICQETVTSSITRSLIRSHSHSHSHAPDLHDELGIHIHAMSGTHLRNLRILAVQEFANVAQQFRVRLARTMLLKGGNQRPRHGSGSRTTNVG